MIKTCNVATTYLDLLHLIINFHMMIDPKLINSHSFSTQPTKKSKIGRQVKRYTSFHIFVLPDLAQRCIMTYKFSHRLKILLAMKDPE